MNRIFRVGFVVMDWCGNAAGERDLVIAMNSIERQICEHKVLSWCRWSAATTAAIGLAALGVQPKTTIRLSAKYTLW